MTTRSRPTPEQILKARADNPKSRERDFAQSLGISEADFVAAHCGLGEDAAMSARRIRADLETLLARAPSQGEVMALTRNESVVHEKIGPFEKTVYGQHASLTLGKDIDLRIFPKHWVHGFAVAKRDGDDVRRSLQFFDEAGEAVHKIHLRPASDVAAYDALVSDLLAADQSPSIETVAIRSGKAKADLSLVDTAAFRERYPGVKVTMRAGNSETVIESLFSYDADIGVLGGIPVGRDFEVINLNSTPIVAFAAADHPAARRKSLSFAELAGLPLIMRERGSKTRRKLEEGAAEAGVELKFAIEAEGREAVREIVAAGAGIGFVSEAEFGNDTRLAKIPIEGPPMLMDEALICLTERSRGKTMRAFLDIARSLALGA